MRPVMLQSIPLLSLLILAGCGGSQAPPTPTLPPPQGVTNHDLGIRLASVPADFKVVKNQGDILELAPSDPAVAGNVVFSLGPEGEVNLVAAMKAHRRHIEEQPGGEYKGGQELVTPLGSAFYSRGRYSAGDQEMEETVVVVLDPGAQRILYMTYRYPAGADSSVRVQQLLDLLGEVESASSSAAGGAANE